MVYGKKTILFGLDSDNVVSDDEIKNIERYYCIQMPERYKVFLKKYGGGYFSIFVHEEKKVIEYQYDLFQALLKYGLKL